ncbi:MAG: AbrB/MazE/SpoVT family DNA-binding domain-containing protein [Pseudomonadota bacterium]
MNHSKLSKRGQVTIPKRVRDHLGLLPGDAIRFEYADGGTVRMVPTHMPAQGKGGKADRFAALRGTRNTGMSTDEIMNLLRGYVDDAVRVDDAMKKSGVGYAMPEVHAYIAAKVRGKRAKRPRPVNWRK